MRTPGIIGLSGKCPGKKLSLIVTFLIATAETPGLYSITLSTSRNGNLNQNQKHQKKIKSNKALTLSSYSNKESNHPDSGPHLHPFYMLPLDKSTVGHAYSKI